MSERSTSSKDSEEASIWLYHLEVDDAEDMDRIAGLDRPRVWVGHFHQIDFKVESETGTDRVSFSGIDFVAVTLFQDFETGYNNWISGRGRHTNNGVCKA
jgi:hypothetical protein